MKKTVSCMMTVLMLVFAIPFGASAVDSKIADFDPTKYANGIVVMYTDGSIKKFDAPDADGIMDKLMSLAADKNVEIVQPNYTYNTAAVSSDPLSKEQWALENEGGFEYPSSNGDAVIALPYLGNGQFALRADATAQKGIDINVKEAWEKYSGGTEVVVALIDTGVDYTHPDLEGILWVNENEIAGNGIDDDHNGYADDVYGWNFFSGNNVMFEDSTDDHATHCAGIIAANTGNGIGIAGICNTDNVKIMSVKVLGGDKGEGTTASIIEGIVYAQDNGADIANLSLGTSFNDRALYKAIKESPMLFVIAAGNGYNTGTSGVNNDRMPIYPASYGLDNIISVANMNYSGKLAASSNYGKITVDLAAPGTYILSTIVGGGYAYMTGTSMATPMVSAVCALVKSHYYNISNDAVREAVLGSVTPVETIANKVATGGMLNAGAALGYNPAGGETSAEQDDTLDISYRLSQYRDINYLYIYVKGIGQLDARYARGTLTKEDFEMEGAEYKSFALSNSKTAVFLRKGSGVYTFYVSDIQGNTKTVTVQF